MLRCCMQYPYAKCMDHLCEAAHGNHHRLWCAVHASSVLRRRNGRCCFAILSFNFPTPFWFSIIMRDVLRVPSSSPPRLFVWPCADTRRSTTLTTRQALATRLLMRDFLLLYTKHKIRIRFTVRRPRRLRSATCYDGPRWVPISSLYPQTPLTPTALAGTLAPFLH